MTDLKFQLLSILYASPNGEGEHEVDLLNHFSDKIIQAHTSLEDLKTDKLVECVIGSTRYKITKSGRVVLEMLKENRKKAVYSEVKYWVTTAIAIAAFIKSFFFI